MNRRVVGRGVALGVVCALGLGSRRYGEFLPGFVAEYAGDTLWAVAAFLAIGLVWRRAPTWAVAAAALGVSVGVELSQLVRAPWLDAIRGTRVGALFLGAGFLWSDLVCYAVGVGVGALAEWGWGWFAGWRLRGR